MHPSRRPSRLSAYLTAVDRRRRRTAFLPQQLLDAYFDPNASYTGTSSDVTALPDLTGNGYDLTYQSGATASTIVTVDGRNMVQMPGDTSNQCFYNAALGAMGSLDNTSPFTVAGVARYSALAYVQAIWALDNNAAVWDTLTYLHYSPAGGATRLWARTPAPVTTEFNLADVTAVDTNFAFVQVFDGAGSVKVWMNGEYEGTYTYAPTGTFGEPNMLSFGGTKGAVSGVENEFRGALGPLGFAGRALTDTEAGDLATYLAGLHP